MFGDVVDVKPGNPQDEVINYIPIHAKTPKIGTSLYSKVPTHTTFIIIKNSYSKNVISYNIVIIYLGTSITVITAEIL